MNTIFYIPLIFSVLFLSCNKVDDIVEIDEYIDLHEVSHLYGKPRKEIHSIYSDFIIRDLDMTEYYALETQTVNYILGIWYTYYSPVFPVRHVEVEILSETRSNSIEQLRKLVSYNNLDYPSKVTKCITDDRTQLVDVDCLNYDELFNEITQDDDYYYFTWVENEITHYLVLDGKKVMYVLDGPEL